MLPVCLTITRNPASQTAPGTNPNPLVLNIQVAQPMSTAAATTEPAEIIRVARTVSTQASSEHRKGPGTRQAIMPAPVATPLPPLKAR